MKNLFQSVFYFLSFNLIAQSPCLPIFNGTLAGDVPPGCFLCNSIYQGSTAGFTPENFTFDYPCGTIENSQWVTVYPNNIGTIYATLQTVNCQNNRGIESIIYDSNFNPVSHCFSSGGSNFSGIITATNLNPLTPYHIIINGKGGDICDILLAFSSVLIFDNIVDTFICPGSCIVVEDSCYLESSGVSLLSPCNNHRGSLNIMYSDTNDFEITYLIDSFTNSLAFNWDDLGADSFDIFIDDTFQNAQSFSSFLLPITPDLKDSFTLRVNPRSHLECPFKTSEIQYPSGRTSSQTDEVEILEESVIISPNPSNSIFNLDSKNRIFETTVFDINGKKMMVEKSEVLNLSPFENGIYFFKIQTDLGMVLKRVLKI